MFNGIYISGVTFTGGFTMTALPVLNIITESEDFLTTEDGDTFIWE